MYTNQAAWLVLVEKRQNRNLKFNVHKSSLACIGALSSTANHHPYHFLFTLFFSLSHLQSIFYLFKFTIFAPPSKVWDFLPQQITTKQLTIYFVISRQYWLGTAKPKNVFRSIINPSTKLMWNFNLTEFSTNWLIDWLTDWLTN